MKSPYVPSPSHSLGFCAVTPLRFDTIYQEISLSFNVERSKFREQARLCCCHWSKSVSQDHRPVSPSSWERLKLHRSHVGLFWAATESGRGQATGCRDWFVLGAGEPLLSQHVWSLLFLLHFVTFTVRRAEECCALRHQVSVPTPPPVYSQLCLGVVWMIYWGRGAITQCHL